MAITGTSLNEKHVSILRHKKSFSSAISQLYIVNQRLFVTTLFHDQASSTLVIRTYLRWEVFVMTKLLRTLQKFLAHGLQTNSDECNGKCYAWLTVPGHAQSQALLKATELTSVPVDSIDDTVLVSRTLVVHRTGLAPAEKSLGKKNTSFVKFLLTYFQIQFYEAFKLKPWKVFHLSPLHESQKD